MQRAVDNDGYGRDIVRDEQFGVEGHHGPVHEAYQTLELNNIADGEERIGSRRRGGKANNVPV